MQGYVTKFVKLCLVTMINSEKLVDKIKKNSPKNANKRESTRNPVRISPTRSPKRNNLLNDNDAKAIDHITDPEQEKL
jgi:hypothetical protein